ncbi:hypothetical protein AAFF_G00266030 [Aldrovandia affinis]|uniref:Uncharacterized protein n=1 Tax=Aldrovandia affinis TaxID=143900 RepID=A0AAD7RBC6_9TELE|nr:hypothetical protein AAFF_G00266030 [Aldrovandia affinis]
MNTGARSGGWSHDGGRAERRPGKAGGESGPSCHVLVRSCASQTRLCGVWPVGAAESGETGSARHRDPTVIRSEPPPPVAPPGTSEVMRLPPP